MKNIFIIILGTFLALNAQTAEQIKKQLNDAGVTLDQAKKIAKDQGITDQQIELMLSNLSEREILYQQLFPWDHPNYGMDEHWVSCYPYEQQVSSGERVNLEVKFTNHSNEPRIATCRPSLPKSWRTIVADQSVKIQPHTTREICFLIDIPQDIQKNKRIVIPVDISYNGRSLGQFREAIFAT